MTSLSKAITFSPARWMEPSGIADGISYLKDEGRERERERERER